MPELYMGKIRGHENSGKDRILPFLLWLTAIPIFANVLAGIKAPQFGMTATELDSEFLLIALYAMAGLLAVVGLKWLTKSAEVLCGVRLMIVLAVIAMSYNQLAVSRELAPIKREFAQAAGQCHAKSGELICGPELKKVLERRDAELKRLHAVRIGDWRVTALHADNYLLERNSAYLFSPF